MVAFGLGIYCRRGIDTVGGIGNGVTIVIPLVAYASGSARSFHRAAYLFETFGGSVAHCLSRSGNLARCEYRVYRHHHIIAGSSRTTSLCSRHRHMIAGSGGKCSVQCLTTVNNACFVILCPCITQYVR